jgi:hypothetical protein
VAKLGADQCPADATREESSLKALVHHGPGQKKLAATSFATHRLTFEQPRPTP